MLPVSCELFDTDDEMAALATLADPLGSGPDQEEALSFIRRVVDTMEPTDATTSLVLASMAKILALDDLPLGDFEPESGPADQQAFVLISKAWIAWSQGDLQTARSLLGQVETHLSSIRGGAIHLIALSHWKCAIQQLLEGDRTEAWRLFRRAIDFGGQMGTETNPAIQWSYVASFFEHNYRPFSGHTILS